MARGELIRKLFKSYVSDNEVSFRNIALEIVAEEQQKQNHALAKDLLEILEKRDFSKKEDLPSRPFNNMEVPSNLIELKQPIRKLSDIIIKDNVRIQINRILEEYQKTELLKLHGLKSKNKILFCGPPGCGKSLCAEIIASELKLPLIYTRFDSIISSYLGETSSNLRKVFDYTKDGSWVILFDEFDAIGKSRDISNDHGEIKRVVNSFLQIIDNYDGDSIIIAATNIPQILDNAIFRRFDEIVFFDKPNILEIRTLLELKLKNFPLGKVNLNELSKRLKGLTHSEIEWICLDSIKTAILEDRDEVTQDLLNNSIQKQKRRNNIKITNNLEK